MAPTDPMADRPANHTPHDLSVEVNRYMQAFEDAWQGGARPDINDYLPACDPARQAVLVELVHIDLERRLKAGESVCVEDYVSRFPELVSPGSGQPDKQHGPSTVPDAAPQINSPPHPPRFASDGVRYRLLRFHARGNLGEVHVAEDKELGREVALKRIQPRYLDGPSSADMQARFVREAEITGRLEHPGVVPVYGLVQDADGKPCYAMRFVEGETLQEAIQRFHESDEQPARDPGERRLAFRELLGRFVAVCQTAAYAHSRGIVHRDLKPANILLGKYGETLVVDWGLAKKVERGHVERATAAAFLTPSLAAAQAAETRPGGVVGTPAYMSPEQASGRLEVLAPASDIYSLGAMLFCLLTGQPPLRDGDVPNVLLAVQQGQFRAPEAVKPGVPPALVAVCRKAMAWQPAQRYATARALADDVARWLADEPVVAYREPLRQRAGRWVRRHKPLVAGLAALVAVVLISVLASWIVVSARSTAAHMTGLRDEAVQKGAEADKQRQRAETAEKLARHYRYDAEMVVAQQAWEAGDVRGVQEILESQRPAQTGGEDLRGFEWYYLWRLAHPGLLTLRREWFISSVCFSPDGRHLAIGSDNGTAEIWDMLTGHTVLAVHGGQGPVREVCFSPDGRRLATGSMLGAELWDARSGKKIRAFKEIVGASVIVRIPLIHRSSRGESIPASKGFLGAASGLSFSPDGDRLAIGLAGGVKVWNARTGKELLKFQGHQGRVLSVRFSSDGRRLATASEDKTISVWDARTGKNLLTLSGHQARVWSVCFSPDGRQLATASEDRTVKLWDAQTGKKLFSIQHHQGSVLSVCFSPDGRWLATGSADKTARVWDAQTGRELFRFVGHQLPVSSISFSRDGRQLATASRDAVKVWDVQMSKNPLAFQARDAKVSSVCFSPDGRCLVTASWDSTASIWDARSGKNLITLQGHRGPVHGVSFSADGRRLATASLDKTAKLWDVQTGQVLLTLKGHRRPVVRVCFSPDGRRLASASDNTVRVWDAQTGGQLLTLEPWRSNVGPMSGVGDAKTGKQRPSRLTSAWPVSSVCFSSDGKRLAIGAGNLIQFWDAQTGKKLRTVILGPVGESPVLGFCFSPHSERLAIAFGDGKAIVCGPQARVLVVLNGHQGEVSSICFSPDGRRVATGSSDMTAKIWDAQTGKNLLTLRGHQTRVVGVSFSPDGYRLVTASEDGAVKIWDGAKIQSVSSIAAATRPHPEH